MGRQHWPEVEQLLRLARTPVAEPCAVELDWPWLIATGGLHGVLPLVCRQIVANHGQNVPRRILRQAQHVAQQLARRSLRLTGELLSLLDLFVSHNITVIPFKGPTLAARAYGDLSLRTFQDLDILVHGDDVPAARSLLRTAGYSCSPCSRQLTRTQEAKDRVEQYHERFVGSDGAIVELHWAFAEAVYSFPVDAESVWNRLEPISVGGRVVLTLGAADTLLLLSAHGAKHRWERLAWICDISELLRREPSINWDELHQRAVSHGAERMVTLALFLASELLDATLPAEAAKRFPADTAVRRLAADVRERLFRQTPSLWSDWAARLFYLRARERPRDRLRFWTRRLLSPQPADWESLRVPDALYGLYFALRPLRLLAKCVRRAFAELHERYVRHLAC